MRARALTGLAAMAFAVVVAASGAAFALAGAALTGAGFTTALATGAGLALTAGALGAAFTAPDLFSLATAAASSSTRLVSASTSLAVGTPSLFMALAVRCSKMPSSLSQFWPALADTVPAMALMRPVTSLIFSSARPWVFFCRFRDRKSVV